MSAIQFTLLGEPTRIAQPELAGIALFALLGMALHGLVVWRRSRQLAQLAPGKLQQLLAPAASPARGLARGLLGWGGLLLASLAASQPQCGSHAEISKKVGIDLVIAIDASRSMLARDVKPSRIERAKLELTSLLDKLKGDRVGLVVFSGDAFVQCPLTSDYTAAKMFLKAIDPLALPVPGTDIGRALDTAAGLLEEADHGASSKVILVLSDGEDFGGEVEAMGKQLADKEIRVISVGIGSVQGEPIPELNKRGEVVGYVRDRQGNTVMTRLDEPGLQKLSEATHGLYVPPVPGAIAVGPVVEEIDRLQKSELESRTTVSYDERFPLLLAPAFALLLLAGLLRPARVKLGAAWAVGGFGLVLAVVAVALEGLPGLIDANGLPEMVALRSQATLGLLAVVLGGWLVALLADLFVERKGRAP